MQRVYESGASAVPPTPPAIASIGYPSRGNPAAGAMPTVPGPYMMHQLVEELMAVITAGGIAPDPLTLNQLKLALDATYLAKNGTSPILQNFAGLTRSVTPLGGGLLREYVDIANAATVGGLEIGNVYNCAVDAMTGVWAGRDIADFCWLEKWHDVAGTKEIWFAPTAAAGTVPVWRLVSSLTAATGALAVAGSITAAPAMLAAQLSTLGQSDARYLPITGSPTQVVSVAPATLPAHAVRLDQFASSTFATGWQKLPGGLILQWGSSAAAPGMSSWIFPLAFPNNCFSIVATPNASQAAATSTSCIPALSLSGFTISNTLGVAGIFRWIAIGY